MSGEVTRPGELLNVPLRELLDAWHSHLTPLVNAGHGLGEPEPVGRLRGAALDMLACGQALVDALNATRWSTIVDALAYGATVAQVAAACGLDEVEVTVGLRSWSDGQLREQLMTPARHAEVLALVAGWFE